MNISLTPQQQRLIQEKLKSGKYSTIDRVVDEALQFLEDVNKAFTALKSNPTAWQVELEERQLWDETLVDGLDWEED